MKIHAATWGNSIAIRLPKKIRDSKGISAGTPLTIEESTTEIIIKKKRRVNEKIDIDAMIKRIRPNTLHEPIDWGQPVGKEVW